MKQYPDMTELFAQKEERRRKLASLPITEKMEIARKLQEIGLRAPGRHMRGKQKVKINAIRSHGKKQRTA